MCVCARAYVSIFITLGLCDVLKALVLGSSWSCSIFHLNIKAGKIGD